MEGNKRVLTSEDGCGGEEELAEEGDGGDDEVDGGDDEFEGEARGLHDPQAGQPDGRLDEIGVVLPEGPSVPLELVEGDGGGELGV